MKGGKPRYGLDAPGWVAIFFGGAVLVLALSLVLRVPALDAALRITAFVLVFEGVWFLVCSFVLKLHLLRPRVLEAARIGKSSLVLDLGTGRGLLAVGAAKLASAGHVVGIDLWSRWDLAGNSLAAARDNAGAEGVLGRVEFKDGDMRALPYAEHAFDCVVSSTALHNIDTEAGRATALAEAMRVLRPGGTLAVADLMAWRYVRVLERLGAREIKVDYALLPLWGMTALVVARKA